MGTRNRRKKHDPDTADAAVIIAASTGSSLVASAATGVPARTIRRYVEQFEGWDDSDKQAYLASKVTALACAVAGTAERFIDAVHNLADSEQYNEMVKAGTIAGIMLHRALPALLAIQPNPRNVTPAVAPHVPMPPPMQGTAKNSDAD